MQNRIVGFIVFMVLGLSLVIIPTAGAEEWDGSRRRRPAETNGVTSQMGIVSGQINEILDNDDTFILRVDQGGYDTWAAIKKPEDSATIDQLQVGNSITLQSGVIMKNYYLKGVGRDFDRIVFSPGVNQDTRTRERRSRERSAR